MKYIPIAAIAALVLGISSVSFAATTPEDVLPDGNLQAMTDQEMDQARGGVGTFTGASDYTRIINLGSYSIVRLANGTWLRVKN